MDIDKESCQSPFRVRIAAGGRIVIPAEVRQDLGLKEGDEVLVTRVDGGLRISTYRNALDRARALVAGYTRPGESLADELSQEREEEAAREARDSKRRNDT